MKIFNLPHGYTEEEWRLFTTMEKKIIVLVVQYGSEEDRARILLGWPLPPMLKSTFRNHRARISKKIREIRYRRTALSRPCVFPSTNGG